MQHLIQKQVFDIAAPNLRLVQQWESRASNLLRKVIMPSIEHCFDELDTKNSVFLINRLEINIGLLHEDISDDSIREKVELAVMNALKDYTAHVNDTKDVGVDSSKSESVPAIESRRLSRQDASVEGFTHFLLHGTLPWWADMIRTDVKDGWVTRITAQQTARIVQILKNHPYTRYRLAQQFDTVFIGTLVRQHQPVLMNDVMDAWHVLESMSATDALGVTFTQLRKEYWVYWIGKIVGADDVGKIALSGALKRWFADKPVVQQWLYDLSSGQLLPRHTFAVKDGGYAILKDVLTSVALTSEVAKTSSGIQKGDADEGLFADDGLPTASSAGSINGYDETADENSLYSESTRGLQEGARVSDANTRYTTSGEHIIKEKKQPAPILEEGVLYAEAAGLVLLHPFLTELFQSGNLWNTDGWTSNQAQHIAVALVSWLANGAAEVPEYQMVIPKLLCGMPTSEVLDTPARYDNALVQSGTLLLEAVIQHWKVLGNVSADALREGFLLRRGKIATRDGGWLITVEKKAQDVLLAKLPWGISMIRLPWCGKQAVHVDWA